ncbi:MAG TPA: aminopeptidase P N-terminal domain-containing protein, partial [Burkholderiaceae bacterium]
MDKTSRDACERRRAQVAAAIRAAGGGIAVLATAPVRPRNGDNDHPYRADSNFLHLT